MNDQLLTTKEAAAYLKTTVSYLKYLRTQAAFDRNLTGPEYIYIENYQNVDGRRCAMYKLSDLDNYIQLK